LISSLSSLKLHKIIARRWLTVAAHASNKLLPPAFNIIISLLIVRYHSKELWGEFVFYALIGNLCSILISWGNQEYLTKAFSQNPGQVSTLWWKNFTTRMLLYTLCVPFVLMMPLPLKHSAALIIWILTLFMYRSFDVLILYYRDFKAATLLDLAGNLFLVTMILEYPDISLYALIVFNTVITALKISGIALFYKAKILKTLRVTISVSVLIESFPFFLPSLVGFIQSRTDMYVIALSLSKPALATYQIFITLLSFIHQVALLATAPYTKNLYRLTDASINAFARMFFIYGSVTSFFAMSALYGIMVFFYHTELSWEAYVIGQFTLMPLFYYSIKTYQWFKHHAQYKVVTVNCIMMIITLGLSLALVPRFGIIGGLLSNCAGQWLAFMMFHFMKIGKPLS
jgi:O-antigen/teichoic acid export membrane protein